MNINMRANSIYMAIAGCLISTSTLAAKEPTTAPAPTTTAVDGKPTEVLVDANKTPTVIAVGPGSQIIGYVELSQTGATGNQLFSKCLTEQSFSSGPNSYGYYESVVKISLDPKQGCPTKVCFILDYDGAPTNWTLNIGDSPNNNGYGGGAASDSTSVAELQILGNEFAAYSTAFGAGMVDQLTSERLQLSQGAFKVCVSDKYARWGNPGGTLNTPYSNILFRVPDNAPSLAGSVPGNGNYDLYAGFNRVIAGGRSGGGLARVIITSQ